MATILKFMQFGRCHLAIYGSICFLLESAYVKHRCRVSYDLSAFQLLNFHILMPILIKEVKPRLRYLLTEI